MLSLEVVEIVSLLDFAEYGFVYMYLIRVVLMRFSVCSNHVLFFEVVLIKKMVYCNAIYFSYGMMLPVKLNESEG